MLNRNRLNDTLALLLVTFIAVLVSTNGFRFTRLFFPADLLAGFSAWHSTHGDIAIRNPLIADPVVEFEPWEKLIATAFHEGRWPLWNPYSFMGTPLLGNGQISAFTIFSIPLHFLPPVPAHFLEAFLKLWIAGTFMYIFGRTLSLGRTAALTSGLVFMLSGHMVAWLHFPLSGGVALSPLLLASAERTLRRASALWFGMLSAAVGMLVLCGQPQTTFTVGVLLAAFSVYRAVHYYRTERNIRSWLAGITSLGAAVVLGLGMSLFQTLPFLEYLQLSAAQTQRNAYNVFYVPLYQLITLLLPDFFGNVVYGNYWGYANNVGPAMYVGVLALLLAVVAVVLGSRDAEVRFFAATAFLCVVIITKQFGVERLIEIPVLAGVTINKFIAPFTLSVAFLTGKGVDLFWLRPRSVLKTTTILLALSSIYTIATVFYFRRWLTELNLRNYEVERAVPLLVLTPVAVIVLWLWYRHFQTARTSIVPALVFVAVAASDPIYCWINFNPSVDSRLFYPTPNTVQFLRENKDAWRLMSIGNAFPPNTSNYFFIQDALGYDGMTYRRFYEFMAMIDSSFKDLAAALDVDNLASKPWNPRTRLFDEYILGLLRSKDANFVTYLKQANYWNTAVRRFDNRRLLDLMNVKYFVAPPSLSLGALDDMDLIYDREVRVYENKNVLPRVSVVPQWTWADNDEEAIRLMSDPHFDPAVTVVLQGNARSLSQPPEASLNDEQRRGSARLVLYESEKVAVEAETPHDALLVLSDVYYPGWKCAVDGKQTEAFVDDYLFRAVHLEPGKHQIVFYYEPTSFVWGFRLSLLSLAATGFSMALMRHVRDRFRPAVDEHGRYNVVR